MRAEGFLPDNVNQSSINGMMVRKGSVGAFLANTKILADPAASVEARATAEHDIIEALPALAAVGLFDVMQVRDEKLRALTEKHLK